MATKPALAEHPETSLTRGLRAATRGALSAERGPGLSPRRSPDAVTG
ncbi:MULTISPECIES: hypothetical protein [unclassified Streptomyces]